MRANPVFTGFDEFASAGDKTEPSSALKASGFLPLEMLPAQIANWLWNRSSKGVTESQLYIDNINKELNNILTSVGASPNNGTSQVVAAINLLIKGATAAISFSTAIEDIPNGSGTYIVTVPESIISLPSAPSSGDIVRIYFKESGRIVQNNSQNGISYKNSIFTKKGAYVSTVGAETGYVQGSPGDVITLVYIGSGISRVDPPVKLTNPATLPTDVCEAVSFSPDGKYLAVPSLSSPYILIYKRSGDTFTKLADPSTLPAGGGHCADFSPDGNYLAVAHNTTPYVTIYKRSGDTFTKLTNPGTLPTGNATALRFSGDGVYLVVGHVGSPYFTIYKRSGDTFTKLANPSSLPVNSCNSVSFSPASDYLAVSHATTPFFAVYKRNGDVFTKLASPSALPAGNGLSAVFSNSGNLLLVVCATSPYIAVYSRSGEVLTKITDPDVALPGIAVDAAFSMNDEYVAIAHASSPRVSVYRVKGESFEKIGNPSTLPTGDGQGVAFSKDLKYMAVGHSTTPFVTIYKFVENISEAWEVISLENGDTVDIHDKFK